MNIVIGLFLIFAILAFYFLVRIVSNARQGRIIRAGGSTLSCVVSAAVASAALVLAFSYYGYSRLTQETIVSTLQFRQTAPDEFEARLMLPGEPDRLFRLRGDEWQLDARVVTWKPPATILGLDPIYRLERLSGRYAEIDRERTEIRTVHALSRESLLDIWTIARKFPVLTPGIDAYYGSATYVPMADGARFDVSLSRDALIARPVNDAAVQAVGRWGTDPD